jgi:hypothetical protein
MEWFVAQALVNKGTVIMFMLAAILSYCLFHNDVSRDQTQGKN